jgi:hypothetical protein
MMAQMVTQGLSHWRMSARRATVIAIAALARSMAKILPHNSRQYAILERINAVSSLQRTSYGLDPRSYAVENKPGRR